MRSGCESGGRWWRIEERSWRHQIAEAVVVGAISQMQVVLPWSESRSEGDRGKVVSAIDNESRSFMVKCCRQRIGGDASAGVQAGIRNVERFRWKGICPKSFSRVTTLTFLTPPRS